MIASRTLVAVVAAGLLSAVPAVAAAQEDTEPTIVVPVTSVVERDVTVSSTDTREIDTDDDDDDSDKTGLWGLLGLLGLAGLLGLKRPKNDAYRTTGTVPADSTARGSSTHDH